MQSLVQKLLLQCEPEKSHDFTINWLNKTQHTPLKWMYSTTPIAKPVTVAGIKFDNPVGLAAGLDKNGDCIDAFSSMGFGFVEIGTVTPRPQPGNPKPRLFRLPEKQAIINRMGFNNKGVDHLVEQVKEAKFKGPIGINIGKNKDTEDAKAVEDYLICLNKVYPYASYITINISSPNTPGLRNLQYGEALDSLLVGLKAAQETLTQTHSKYVPMFIKIAPDLSDDEISSIAVSLMNSKMDGVIATNTTLSRDAVQGLAHADEMGGLSGSVMTDMSLQVTKKLDKALDKSMPIIGVGGIDSPESAQARLDAGASLVQLYSAFIYQGPSLVKRIVNAL
ncbi:quinone-dependent dihydroorotate dehydrogenase [Alteromonas sp.]|uniref:quinone-dependent dihydroorotate dehydrogenase n=1 Tax=Alteromonas sp. TaxID=232 RepID=UPI000B697CD0|nr:quinone-dependent dihydroorotate dehydrogenase [Alteromonas sp.]MAI36579.1 dihydroorotate dehydrogenase (quinone) [Alteromonas sp.]OUX91036.1 MAG: dihydroorotate dehydrogenase (quinone) [Alteromonas sp. TMED35]|tara:strand:+ start:48759 stop:49766 length:1008 start_codon:yes stop_codon:yes gene_type:complete